MLHRQFCSILLFSLALVAFASLSTGAATPNPAAQTAPSTGKMFTYIGAAEVAGAARLNMAADSFSSLKNGPARRLLSLPQPDGPDFELDLTRFTFMIPQSAFYAAGPTGQISMQQPDVVAFRGRLAGQPRSHAFLSVSASGKVNGYVTQSDGVRYFVTSNTGQVANAGSLTIARESATSGMFADTVSCGVSHVHDLRLPTPPAVARGANDGRPPRLLYVAIDADQYFYQLFNDLTASQEYIAQTIAAISDIYMRDFDAKLVLTFSRVWSAGGEPFSAHDLAGFADYWFFNEDPSPYHLIHLMSGRRDTSYGGIAYVAGSCSGSAFGISAFLLGSFPTPVGEPNLQTWDIVVVAHEMGHNMGTFHTHDGYNPPIDQCGSSGIWSRGEIMSYCHTLAGGLLNTELRFTSRVQEVVRDDLEFNNCQAFDCNDNGISDAVDLANSTSPDVNGNQVPDECEDCNSNGTLDPAEISGGAPDINGNGVPDICEPDCDNNGRPDPYDISNFFAPDVNLNLVPDSCETDCDSNEFPDFVQIFNSAGALDLDRNGTLDACQDCDSNGTSDWIDMLRPHNIFIADLADVVREFHAASGAAVVSHVGVMLDPYDVTFGPDRMAYVASNGNHRVMRINPDNGTVTTFVPGASGGLSGPSGVTFGPNNNLYVSSLNTNSVLEFNVNGVFLRTFVSSGSGGLSSPYGLVFGPNGNLFVAGGNRVIEYDRTTGALIGDFIAPGAGGLAGARGLTFLPDGRLLVVSRTTNQILAYAADGTFLGQFNDHYPLAGLWGIAVGPNGNVYVTRVSGGVRVIEYDVTNGRYIRSFIRGDSVLNQPTGIAFRPESPTDCNNNSALDSCDIADGIENDENSNNIPDSCEVACTPIPPPTAAPDGINKNRYLTFDLGTASEPRAIHITLADLPPPFEAFEGQGRWVSFPLDRPDTQSTTFKAAALQCDPFYSSWSGVGVLAVYDPAIMPGGRYEIHAITDGCPLEDQLMATPLEIVTVPRWGDVVAPFNPPSPTVQPDITDISALVDKFRNDPSAVPMARADVFPNVPDQVLDFSDISMVVDAFRGLPYPLAGPSACP